MERVREIAATYEITGLGEQGDGFAYWRTQSYEARLSALEAIRQEYHRW